MFDFGKITDAIGGLLSNGQSQLPEGAGGIAQILQNAGVDPALLDGLNQEEVLAFLQQQGIDTSAIDPGQIMQLLQHSGVTGNLGEIAQAWLESRKG